MHKKTKGDLSLFLKILIIPVKKEPIAENATASPGSVNLRLPKNVAPPLSPKEINIKNTPKKIIEAIIKLTDNLPKRLFGINLIFIYLTAKYNIKNLLAKN